MDLIVEPWLPIIRTSQRREKISLLQLFDDDVRDVAYPRADFQGAAWQLLIGLLQTTVAPEDEDDWFDVWSDGIAPDKWASALQSVAPAMQFGAQKPSFLQSYEPLDSENASISGLLIDAPGGNTLKLNKDHFVKRHVGERICPHCAVMALFAVQTNSPAGGAGYRVGLRGGGPLTTLVTPLEDTLPLWKKLWLNVLLQEERPAPSQLALVFPWLVPTRTSEKAGNVVTPENAHPLQAYWSMPRRIELDFDRTAPGVCDLCGESHDALLLEMRNKNYGVQYDGWIHPLSPYRQALKDSAAPLLALKGQPGGLIYRDWLGLALESEDKFNRTQPARVVRAIAGRRQLPETGLWCFAWDMDNAKARCWYQHRIPLVRTTNPEKLNALLAIVLQLASGTLAILKSRLKDAKEDISTLDIAYWQETEPFFSVLLHELERDPERRDASTRHALRAWEGKLYRYLFTVFDREAFAEQDGDEDSLHRRLRARRRLDEDYLKQKQRKDLLALAQEREEQHV